MNAKALVRPCRRRRRYSRVPVSASLPISRNSMRIARSRCSWVSEEPFSAARNAARPAAGPVRARRVPSRRTRRAAPGRSACRHGRARSTTVAFEDAGRGRQPASVLRRSHRDRAELVEPQPAWRFHGDGCPRGFDVHEKTVASRSGGGPGKLTKQPWRRRE